MKHSINGTYGRVELRPLDYQGAELMRQLRNRNRHSFVTSDEITENKQKEWFEQYLLKPDEYMFSVYHSNANKWIGAVGIYNLNKETGVAEFGRLVIDGDIVNERGLGTDTTICASEIAFSILNIKTLILEVYADNIAAIKTYSRSGFKNTGVSEDTNGKKMFLMEKKK